MPSSAHNTNGTTFVIGDIGGQLGIFQQSLLSIGVDLNTMVLPAGVTIVQLGDVIRMNCSPVLDNNGVLSMVEKLKKKNPRNYIQLWGNHEYGALNWPFQGCRWQVEEELQESMTKHMKSWVRSGSTTVAASSGDTLITHAGLTHGYWKQLGAPSTASETAQALNADSLRLLEPQQPYGYILNRYTAETDTNVLWAEAATETYSSWLHSGEEMPFNQVHGHDTPFSYEHSRLKPHTPLAVAELLTVDHERRRTVMQAGERTLTCIDWCLAEQRHESSWEVFSLQKEPTKALSAVL